MPLTRSARNGRRDGAGQSAPLPVVPQPAIFQGPPAARKRRLTPGRVLAAVLVVALIAFAVTRFIPPAQEQAQPEEQEQQADESSHEQTSQQEATTPKTWNTQTEQTFTFVDSGGT